MEWSKETEKVDGQEVQSFYGKSKIAGVAIGEILTGRGEKTGAVSLRAYNHVTGADILRTVRLVSDPGEDPCATARAKAEEFIKLFDL